MLHVTLRGRQARAWLPAIAMLVAVAAFAPPPQARAAAGESLAASAENLSRTGKHAEAAKLYEQDARRGFFRWDARTSLLAAREYLEAKQLDDAERMLGKVRGPLREDDAILRARVEAELALARNDPQRALGALRGLPQPLPAPLAAELLALRARAEFGAGRTIDGLRTLEERGQLLGAPAARAANDRLLVDELLEHPAKVTVPPDANDRERGWIELGQLLAAPGDPAALARSAAEWRQRHPGHPGAAFLPIGTQVGTTTAGVAPAATAATIPATAPATIGLLLPLSGRQEGAGLAVREGFMAAWFAAPAEDRPRIEIYDSAASGGVVAAYKRAVGAGMQLVVGPLLREDVALLAVGPPLPVPTLALNAYAGDTPPPFLFQFALDPEQEARAVARRIADDGLRHGVALFPDSPWGQRIREALTAELQAAGVTLTASAFYMPGTRDFSEPLRQVLGRFGGAGDRSRSSPKRDPAAEQRDGPQFAFVAATPTTARTLRPQLRFQMTYELPIYSTSDAWDPGVRAASDMDGMVYPEMPWILYGGQGASSLWDVVHGELAEQARGRLRLYAFGFDAYRIAAQLRGNSRTIGLQGLTGELDIGADGRVTRHLQFARIEDGHPVPATGGPPLPAPAASTTPAAAAAQ